MRFKQYLAEGTWEVVRKNNDYYLIDTSRSDPWSNPQKMGPGEKARQAGLKLRDVRNKGLKEEKPVWLSMPRDELKKFRGKCKHEWSFKGEYLQGKFFQCEKCGCEGKQMGKQVKRVRK